MLLAGHAAAQAPLRLAALAPAASPAQPEGRAMRTDPFVGRDWRAASGPLVAKWNLATRDLERDRLALARCRSDEEQCDAASRRMLAIVTAVGDRHGRARIGHLNRAINLSIRPASDAAQFGVPDRWSPPLVTLSAGRGDCEDYALAKYLALREAGFAASELRLVIVRLPLSGIDHAVLAVRHEGRWLILDNRRLALLDAGDIDGEPLFVFGEDAVRARDAHLAMADAGEGDPAAGSATGELPVLM
ncbi:MAG: transglutaminase-like cysteine peptidase [Pseudorhodoplanes sp.]|nr:transglutaminase-like cysteine peptidase [Pseudorhodoplanes sp.]